MQKTLYKKSRKKKIENITNEGKDALLNYTKAYYIFDTFIAQYTEDCQNLMK